MSSTTLRTREGKRESDHGNAGVPQLDSLGHQDLEGAGGGLEVTIEMPVEKTASAALLTALRGKIAFRSLGSLVKETGFSPQVLRHTIESNLDKVRVSPAPDRDGRTLYVLQDRVPRWTFGEWFTYVRAIIAKEQLPAAP